MFLNKPLIEVNELEKSYKDFKSEKISFSIYPREILGIIGENGSGKTTIIKQILNLVKRDSGIIKIFGENIDNVSKDVFNYIGVVFDENYLPADLNINQIENIMCKLYKKWDTDYFSAIIREFILPLNKTINTFSRGMKMKLNIAIALSHNPRLLILDEATSGLSNVYRQQVLNILSSFVKSGENGILLTSHIQDDFDKIVNKTILLKNT